MIRDMHLHTDFSDGSDTLEVMVLNAVKLGLTEIGFTDHVWKTSDWVLDYLRDIENLKVQYQGLIKIVAGVEAKLLDVDGTLDVDDTLYKKNIRIVAAMHRIPIGGGEFIGSDFISNNKEKSKNLWLKAFRSISLNKQVECIAHPFSLLGIMGITENDDVWWKTVSDIIESKNCNIEYNIKYDNSIVPIRIWQRFKDRVVIGSDSHSVKELFSRYESLIAAHLMLNS